MKTLGSILIGLVFVAGTTAGMVTLETKAQSLLDHLLAGEAEAASADFDATMKGALGPEKLAELNTQLAAQLGKLVARGEPRRETLGAYTAVFIPCDFEKAKLDAKIVFDREERVAGLFFVPSVPPAKPPAPLPGRSREVTVGAAGWPLPGTLTLPEAKGTYPAVILVHGSGPNDRDEKVGRRATFRDLAAGLVERGIAVLRYDKRTLALRDRVVAMQERLTVADEAVDDAAAAVTWLQQQPEIDPDRVFVVGHSLGATLAPRIALAAPKVAGLVLIAGSLRPLPEVYLAQIEYIAHADGTFDDTEVKALAEEKRKVGELRKLEDPAWKPTEPLVLGLPAAYWRDFLAYDPVATAMKVPQPMLILQGERDYQVTMADFDLWKKGLGARADVGFRSFPELDHLLGAGEGPSTPADYEREAPVDLRVCDAIAQWIRALGAKAQPAAAGTAASKKEMP